MASFLGRVGGNRMSMPASRLLHENMLPTQGELPPLAFASNRLAVTGIARPGTFYGGVRAYG